MHKYDKLPLMIESPEPRIRYETIEGDAPFCDIKVDPAKCGLVMRELGIPNSRIQSTTILVSSYVRSLTPLSRAAGEIKKGEIVLYGGGLENDYDFFRRNEEFDENTLSAPRRFIYRNTVRRYIDRQKSPLLERLNKDVQNTLLHELKHVADGLDTKSGLIKSKIASLGIVMGGALPYAFVLANTLLPNWLMEPVPIFAAKFLVAQVAALSVISATGYYFSPYELRARAFANKALKDSRWDGLVTFTPKTEE